MQPFLDAHHTPFFELVDKYFTCQSESIFNDVLASTEQIFSKFIEIITSICFYYSRCQLELEDTALHYKEELEHNISHVSTEFHLLLFQTRNFKKKFGFLGIPRAVGRTDERWQRMYIWKRIDVPSEFQFSANLMHTGQCTEILK